MISDPAPKDTPGVEQTRPVSQGDNRQSEGTACPRCGSDTVYRYGKTHTGKARFRCLSCGRQFAFNAHRRELKKRPLCPKCGSKMHLYGKGVGFARFRCASYPTCKSYLKVEEIE